MKITTKMALIGTCCISMSLMAEDLINPAAVDEWYVNGNYKIKLNDAEKAFEVDGNDQLISAKMVDIDLTKMYKLSADIKQVAGTQAFIYFGVIPFNGESKQIEPQTVNVVAESATTLAANCARGDKTIKIIDAFNWKMNPYGVVAFDIDDSGKYRDLPNFYLSSPGIEKVEKVDGGYLVSLKSPLNVDFTAGTKVRLHQIGGTYIYAGGQAIKSNTEWQTIEGTISGEQIGTINDYKKWWKGTAKARLVIIPALTGNAETKSMIKNIKLSEVTDK